MTTADTDQRIKSKLADLLRLVFLESMVVWALANYSESHGYPVIRDVFYFVLFCSVWAAVLINLYPIVPKTNALLLAFAIFALVIAALMFPQAGAPMPNSMTGKLRFAVPVVFTLFTAYSWYLAFRYPSPKVVPTTVPTSQVALEADRVQATALPMQMVSMPTRTQRILQRLNELTEEEADQIMNYSLRGLEWGIPKNDLGLRLSKPPELLEPHPTQMRYIIAPDAKDIVYEWAEKRAKGKTESDSSKPSLPPMVLPDGRVMVNVAPEYLTGFFVQHMSIHAKKLAEPFIGKWMKISGQLAEISPGKYSIAVRFIDPPVSFLSMSFKHDWKDRLEILRRGDQITVLGKLTEISRTTIRLEDCEIMDDKSQPAVAGPWLVM